MRYKIKLCTYYFNGVRVKKTGKTILDFQAKAYKKGDNRWYCHGGFFESLEIGKGPVTKSIINFKDNKEIDIVCRITACRVCRGYGVHIQFIIEGLVFQFVGNTKQGLKRFKFTVIRNSDIVHTFHILV